MNKEKLNWVPVVGLQLGWTNVMRGPNGEIAIVNAEEKQIMMKKENNVQT